MTWEQTKAKRQAKEKSNVDFGIKIFPEIFLERQPSHFQTEFE